MYFFSRALLGVELGELAVGTDDPSPGGDAVGLVLELLGVELVKVGEERRFDELRVDLGHAVHRVRSYYALEDEWSERGRKMIGMDYRYQVGHSDALGRSLVDDREVPELVHVAGELLLYSLQEEEIDEEDDFQVPGQHLAHEVHPPGLQRLGQHRVIRIGKRLVADRKGSVPI